MAWKLLLLLLLPLLSAEFRGRPRRKEVRMAVLEGGESFPESMVQVGGWLAEIRNQGRT